MTVKEIENIDFEKGNGIVPVIVQDLFLKKKFNCNVGYSGHETAA